MGTAVARVVRILDLLANAEKPQPLGTIAATIGAPKSSVHGILQDLVAEGFVESSEPGHYTVGLKAFEVGSALLRRSDAVIAAAAELSALTRRLEITSHYAVLAQTDVLYLCKVDPPLSGVQLASSVGSRLPAHLTAVGKACLAWLDDSEVVAHVDLSVVDSAGRRRTKAQLAADLTVVRERGHAVDNGETVAGIHCVAAPVFDLTGCCGAVGVSFLRGLPPDPTDGIVDEVVAAAARMTTRLGGRSSR